MSLREEERSGERAALPALVELNADGDDLSKGVQHRGGLAKRHPRIVCEASLAQRPVGLEQYGEDTAQCQFLDDQLEETAALSNVLRRADPPEELFHVAILPPEQRGRVGSVVPFAVIGVRTLRHGEPPRKTMRPARHARHSCYSGRHATHSSGYEGVRGVDSLR